MLRSAQHDGYGGFGPACSLPGVEQCHHLFRVTGPGHGGRGENRFDFGEVGGGELHAEGAEVFVKVRDAARAGDREEPLGDDRRIRDELLTLADQRVV